MASLTRANTPTGVWERSRPPTISTNKALSGDAGKLLLSLLACHFFTCILGCSLSREDAMNCTPKGRMHQQLKTKSLQPLSPLDALTLKWLDAWRSQHWVACFPAGSALRWSACRMLANLRWVSPLCLILYNCMRCCIAGEPLCSVRLIQC